VKIYAESTGTDCPIIKYSERNKRKKAFSSVWKPASIATRQGIRRTINN
jgi:hypothetical protein